ncbi:hypothetical protein X805_33990 [Sphaerotilus natans subsp. natans DSM 6575]|uniref:Uncharacterized protein n=1 Tax=Sphaerotilus natans subsp. natans DSM 6575 TaxID=1286631 RepID=A0A059KIY1_9BURK|nr:hypothetical protein X805_33990 [Sphaerotilus natans subsp. natans DSM 6575]
MSPLVACRCRTILSGTACTEPAPHQGRHRRQFPPCSPT